MGIHPSEVRRDEYIEYSIKYNIVRLNKVQLNDLGGFKENRNNFFPSQRFNEETKTIDKDTSLNEQSDEILAKFVSYIKRHNRVPTLAEFEIESEIKVSSIKKIFENTVVLFEKASQIAPEIKDLVFNEESFTSEYFADIQEQVKKHKRFIVTTAVSGKMVDENFLDALRNYSERNEALILVLPCEDVASRKSIHKWELDHRLKDCRIIFKDLYLNNNIYINDIKVSAKQIEPLRGLQRFTQANGSTIIASTKQYLQFVANSNVKLPRALMTTGSVTVPDYMTDKYMSKRTSKIAEFDHVRGCIIVEIEDDEVFHFRQVQAIDDGSFIDLGIEYRADGTIADVEGTVVVFGDSHVGAHDLDVMKKQEEIVKEIRCKDIILHDIFNASSITHHDIGKPAIKAAKAMKGLGSLETEGNVLVKYLEEVGSWIPGKLVIVKSNHDEHLDRYLTEGRFINDPTNFYFSLDLVKKLIEGSDPLKYMIEEVIGFTKDVNTDILWLERDVDYPVYGIENGSHGDIGSNGAKGSLVGMEKSYGKATVGHSHVAGIHRQVFSVGTSSHLRLDYNKGASSWTNSLCLTYPSGSRQLINVIANTKTGQSSWRLKD